MLESLPSVYEALSLILSSNERRERVKKRERENVIGPQLVFLKEGINRLTRENNMLMSTQFIKREYGAGEMARQLRMQKAQV